MPKYYYADRVNWDFSYEFLKNCANNGSDELTGFQVTNGGSDALTGYQVTTSAQIQSEIGNDIEITNDVDIKLKLEGK